MKSHKTLRIFPSAWICIFLLLGAVSFKGFAQINTNDPTLKMWLQASTLSTNAGNGVYLGNNVTNWLDNSTNGLIFVPPPLPSADQGYPSNRCPILISVTNAGYTFQAVDFRNADDPIAGSGPTAYADRLWQGNDTNAGDASDPTLIYATNDMTLFFVYQNNAPNSSLGPDDCIMAKRGPSTCPYAFYLAAVPLKHADVDYADANIYESTNPIPSHPEWGVVEMNVTAAGVITFQEYYALNYGWKTSVGPIVRADDTTNGQPITFSFHTQGAGGSSGNPWGNGTYERFSGYVAEVALYNRTLSPTEEAGVQDQLLLKYFLQPGPPQISIQPTNVTVPISMPASFAVLPNGTPPFTYQWVHNSQPIPGANASAYSLVGAYTTNAGNYYCIVSNSISFIDSSNAVLTVLTNLTPNLVSALEDYTNQLDVIVTFSQSVNPASAAVAADYSINNGVTVSGVTLITNNLNTVTSVQLTTSGLSVSPSILTVNNVQGLYGGVIPTNSQAVIPIPVAAGTPPSANLILWLEGDAGVIADPYVTFWADQSAYSDDVSGPGGAGQPTLQQFAFPNAVHPVVNFPGLVDLSAASAPQTTTMSIYVVGDVNNTKLSDDFCGIWTGWGLGISDGTAGVVKWVTYQPNGNNDNESPNGLPPLGAQLGNRVPALVEGSFVEYGQKSLYVDGYLVDTESTNEGINYGGATLSIGGLAGGGTQPLVGDIAELMIYANVSSAQDAAVQAYITKKYFTPSLTLPTLESAVLASNSTTSVTVTFSEPVTGSTATNTANYSINNLVTVLGASLEADGTNVVLTTSPIVSGGPTYVLTVNNVADWAGNAIAANSQIDITTALPNLHLYIQPDGNNAVLTWSNATAVLNSASAPQGPWTPVVATSPYTTPDSSGTLFYKLTMP